MQQNRGAGITAAVILVIISLAIGGLAFWIGVNGKMEKFMGIPAAAMNPILIVGGVFFVGLAALVVVGTARGFHRER